MYTFCWPQSSQQQTIVYADIHHSDDRPPAPPINEAEHVVYAEVVKTATVPVLVECTTTTTTTTTTIHTVSEKVSSM